MSAKADKRQGRAIVILNKVKDLLAHPAKQILRFAQNDKFTTIVCVPEGDIAHS